MRIKDLNNIAFTLLEVLLAAIIFVITISGLFVTLNAMRAPVANKETALTAAVFGKQVLEALRDQVSTASAANYNTCSSVNASDGSCADFSLSLQTTALAKHEVNHTTLATYGLTWPTSLASSNTTGCNGGDASGLFDLYGLLRGWQRRSLHEL